MNGIVYLKTNVPNITQHFNQHFRSESKRNRLEVFHVEFFGYDLNILH